MLTLNPRKSVEVRCLRRALAHTGARELIRTRKAAPDVDAVRVQGLVVTTRAPSRALRAVDRDSWNLVVLAINAKVVLGRGCKERTPPAGILARLKLSPAFP